MGRSTVEISRHDHSALIRLKRPEARNVISMALMADLAEAVRSASAGEIHSLIIAGTTRHFHRGAI